MWPQIVQAFQIVTGLLTSGIVVAWYARRHERTERVAKAKDDTTAAGVAATADVRKAELSAGVEFNRLLQQRIQTLESRSDDDRRRYDDDRRRYDDDRRQYQLAMAAASDRVSKLEFELKERDAQIAALRAELTRAEGRLDALARENGDLRRALSLDRAPTVSSAAD